jgi:hypothetical protein
MLRLTNSLSQALAKALKKGTKSTEATRFSMAPSRGASRDCVARQIPTLLSLSFEFECFVSTRLYDVLARGPSIQFYAAVFFRIERRRLLMVYPHCL